MSFLRKIGKGILVASEGAKKMDEGFDRVFGEDRTRPGESFSMDNAGKKAGDFTRSKKEDDRDFFGKSEDDEDRRFF